MNIEKFAAIVGSSITSKNHLFLPFILSSVIIFASCSRQADMVVPEIVEEIPEEPEGYENVDEALWNYFDRFEEEAAERGIAVDIRAERITGFISEIEEDNVAGTCNYNFRNPNKVTIDASFWNRSSDRFREFVVFHELGHCILYRDHKEDANQFNVCESIMRSGTGTCFDNYNRNTRSDYLDELFDPVYEGDIFAAVHEF